jgi:hypothetical protein
VKECEREGVRSPFEISLHVPLRDGRSGCLSLSADEGKDEKDDESDNRETFGTFRTSTVAPTVAMVTPTLQALEETRPSGLNPQMRRLVRVGPGANGPCLLSAQAGLLALAEVRLDGLEGPGRTLLHDNDKNKGDEKCSH